VANILAKLELSSRTQIATWGVAHGLLSAQT
jgi:DNA-binding CsgD family transcriptional regulator